MPFEHNKLVGRNYETCNIYKNTVSVNSEAMCIIVSPEKTKYKGMKEHKLLHLTFFVKIQVLQECITPVYHQKKILENSPTI